MAASQLWVSILSRGAERLASFPALVFLAGHGLDRSLSRSGSRPSLEFARIYSPGSGSRYGEAGNVPARYQPVEDRSGHSQPFRRFLDCQPDRGFRRPRLGFHV